MRGQSIVLGLWRRLVRWPFPPAQRQRGRHTRGRSYRPQVEVFEDRRLLATFLVTTTDDAGPGSLRQAILDANANRGLDTIAFDIGGGGLQTIHPSSALPTITDPVILDGTSQPGFGGSPLIVLNGSMAVGQAYGLRITAGGSNIRGLVINGGFQLGGIRVEGNGGNMIAGNYIGTDVTGTAASGNSTGIDLDLTSDNVIGGITVADRNIISGNGTGIYLFAGKTLVQGNFIGTDVTGTVALGNQGGIFIGGGSNMIGGTAEGAGNLISGNHSGAIYMNGSGNKVQGNFIGTDVTGTQRLGNNSGVSSSGGNTIGGAAPGAGNLISANQSLGISLIGPSDHVEGNFIGTDVTGKQALGNGTGIYAVSTSATIGGTTPGAGNLISGNQGYGIEILGSQYTILVQGNCIGTDITGTQALGNGLGVYISGQGSNTIGGTMPGGRNLISGNTLAGILTSGGQNLVQGNYIGTDATGTLPLGNQDGVAIDFYIGSVTTIGGATAEARNIISGNRGSGVHLMMNAKGNRVQGNYIGTDVTGTAGLGNRIGVELKNDFISNNMIGGPEPGAGNIISANSEDGVLIAGYGNANNVVQGNYIGTDKTGTANLGNSGNGMTINGVNAVNNRIGGTTEGTANTIAFNGGDGVLVDNATKNPIRGNAIFAHTGLGIRLLHGGNYNQAFPVLTSAISDGRTTTIEGAFQSTPETGFSLEFFSDTVCNPSGFGEGEHFLGSMMVMSDSNGDVNFTATFDLDLAQGQFVTATATDSSQNTSQFSPCMEVTEAKLPGLPAADLRAMVRQSLLIGADASPDGALRTAAFQESRREWGTPLAAGRQAGADLLLASQSLDLFFAAAAKGVRYENPTPARCSVSFTYLLQSRCFGGDLGLEYEDGLVGRR